MAQIHPIFITQQLYNDILWYLYYLGVFVNMEIFFKNINTKKKLSLGNDIRKFLF